VILAHPKSIHPSIELEFLEDKKLLITYLHDSIELYQIKGIQGFIKNLRKGSLFRKFKRNSDIRSQALERI
jgi:hypothetical protein